MLEDHEQQALQEGFAWMLRDPRRFLQKFEQPAGETWKHFLWDCAKQLIDHEEKARKDQVANFMNEHKLTDLEALCRYVALEICPRLDELMGDFQSLDLEQQKQQKQITQMQAWFRAVEDTVNKTVQRVEAQDLCG